MLGYFERTDEPPESIKIWKLLDQNGCLVASQFGLCRVGFERERGEFGEATCFVEKFRDVHQL
jgi:hypothetical protein